MRTGVLFLFIIVLYSCSLKPAKIEYGRDACYFCKMNIVEKTHAAQIVTKKGRTFKYDAIECMLNDLKNKDHNKIGLFLITDYSTPENLIDARKAAFLISESIQSPMGANLSGFKSKEDAIKIIDEKRSGKIYDWFGIQKLFYN